MSLYLSPAVQLEHVSAHFFAIRVFEHLFFFFLRSHFAVDHVSLSEGGGGAAADVSAAPHANGTLVLSALPWSSTEPVPLPVQSKLLAMTAPSTKPTDPLSTTLMLAAPPAP